MHRIAPALILAVTAGGLATAVHAQQRTFDPVAFFTGRTVGEGQLKKVFSSAQTTHAVGHGYVKGGDLVLDQTIDIEGEPSRERQWRLHKVGPGHWSGTLTDAKGPVEVTVEGPVMRVRYTSNDNMAVSQAITLGPEGQRAHNVMKIKKLGITFATIDETITRK